MKTLFDHPQENASPSCAKAPGIGTLEAQGALADFMEAFMRASGLPLELSGKEGTGSTCCGMEIPGFCQLIHNSHSPRLKQMCGLFNRHLEEMAVDHPHESRCFAGIHMSAIPLRENLGKVGYLKTGVVMPQPPVAADFRKVMRLLSGAGLDSLAKRAEKAWLAIPVMEPKRYQAFVDLLAAFGRQISGKAPAPVAPPESPESNALRMAQGYIEKNSAKALKLSEVAQSVGLSPNYFCRKFRDFTGLSFTDYLAGIRVANAARLLLDPKMRIKEVAYETGFNSISQFNRVFRVTMGMSPSDYRHRMLTAHEKISA